MKTTGSLVYDLGVGQVGQVVAFDAQFVSCQVLYTDGAILWRSPDALESLEVTP